MASVVIHCIVYIYYANDLLTKYFISPNNVAQSYTFLALKRCLFEFLNKLNLNELKIAFKHTKMTLYFIIEGIN